MQYEPRLCALVDELLHYFSANDKSKKCPKNFNPTNTDLKYYWFINCKTWNVIEGFKILGDEVKIKGRLPTFIDVGCGIGWIVRLARNLGYNAYGIDIDKDLLDLGKKIFNLKYPILRLANALNYDYSKYDVIYLYHPIFNHSLERELEFRILEQAKKGSIIFAPNNEIFDYDSQEDSLETISYQYYIYRKL